MNRRKYLASFGVSTTVAFSGCYHRKNAKSRHAVLCPSESDSESYEVYEDFPDPSNESVVEITGGGGPNFPDIERYTSEVFWMPDDYYQDGDWSAIAKLQPTKIINGRIAESHIYLNKTADYISDYTLYHERGHNLGFPHDDVSIMSYDTPDKELNTTHQTTRAIVENTEGAQYIEWDDSSFETWYDKWKTELLFDEQMLYILDQYMKDQQTSDVFSSRQIINSIRSSPESVLLYGGGFYREDNDGWKS